MDDFDLLAGHVFSSVTSLMGGEAVWHKSKSETVTGKVLFKNPTEPVNIGDTEKYEYRPNSATAEYYEGTFERLKERVDKFGRRPQILEIKGQRYAVVSVETKFDGKTFVAYLEKSANFPDFLEDFFNDDYQ
jgi:hypothetical protein